MQNAKFTASYLCNISILSSILDILLVISYNYVSNLHILPIIEPAIKPTLQKGFLVARIFYVMYFSFMTTDISLKGV